MKLPKFLKIKLPFKIIRNKDPEKIPEGKRWRYAKDGKTKIPVDDDE